MGFEVSPRVIHRTDARDWPHLPRSVADVRRGGVLPEKNAPSSRFALAVSVSIAGIFLVGGDAATYTWDANGAAVGRDRWCRDLEHHGGQRRLVGWPHELRWSNAAAQDAVFGSGNGAAGTVTIGSAITVGNLTFNPASSSNYTSRPRPMSRRIRSPFPARTPSSPRMPARPSRHSSTAPKASSRKGSARSPCAGPRRAPR